jgi:hypothetical protein
LLTIWRATYYICDPFGFDGCSDIDKVDVTPYAVIVDTATGGTVCLILDQVNRQMNLKLIDQ